MDACTYYVYVIAHVRDGEPVAPVKVGISNNVAARLATIQTSCPGDLRLMHAIGMPHLQIAKEMEGCFHQLQREHRLRGEWFDLDPWQALGWLITYFRWALEVNGVGEDIIPDVLELSGVNAAHDKLVARHQGKLSGDSACPS